MVTKEDLQNFEKNFIAKNIMRLPITLIVLTYNEEKNLDYCLASTHEHVEQIIVVDSGSTDKTIDIARVYGTDLYTHPFTSQANQFNWALDNVKIKMPWILRLDADERMTDGLWKEIEKTFPNIPLKVTGFLIKRRMYFMGRWIRHGGYYPAWFLRIWRNGKGRAEERKMDEHIILLEGQSVKLQNDFVDNNLNGISHWVEKHKNYAVREAEEILAGKYGRSRRRNFYYSLPPFLRVLFYFLYRYFIRLGFLDGIPGFVFHFLHGFWYRFLVDIKIYMPARKNF